MPKCLKPVYYLQGDPKWGSKTYKSPDQKHQTIAGAGCGITCAAMVIATLRPNTKTTPAETAKWSMAHGYKSSSGTTWGYFVPQMKKFNISCKFVSHNSQGNSTIIKALRTGENFVIASMAPGNWTRGGHYILAYYMDKNYVYINDPASTRSNRTKNKISLFTSQAKGYWIISHKGNVKDYSGDAWSSSDSDSDSSSSSSDDSTDNGVTGLHIRVKDETNNGQGNSNLASYVNRLNDEDADARTDPINCITIHSAYSTGSLEKLASMIKSSKTNYNYGIDSDGVIGLFVDESYAANSTGNKANDARSVNIVCMNKKLSPNYTITDACKESLIDLCEDICRRRYITQLVYNAKKPAEGTLTLHSQFPANKKTETCPGPYITKHLDEIIKAVNDRLNTENLQRVTVTSWQAESETAAYRAQSTVEIGQISPYIARIGHDTLDTDFKALEKAGVVGLLFHGGSYYDEKHEKRPSYADVHLDDQITGYKKSKSKLPYAIDYYTRAKTLDEAKLECKGLYYIVSKYRPKLGVWVNCQLDAKIKPSLAADIVDIYYEFFVKWGFQSKCGIIATKEMAKIIGWPKQAGYMPLWLQGSMDDKLAPMEEILTPSYFKLDDLKNKGYNEKKDKDKLEEVLDDLKSKFGSSSSSDDDYSEDTGDAPNVTKVDVKAPDVGVEKEIPEPIPAGANKGQYRTNISIEFTSKSVAKNYCSGFKAGWPYKAGVGKNVKVDSNGIGYMKIKGVKRYGSAFTPVFGNDGALIDLKMSDGKVLHFVKLDGKGNGSASDMAAISEGKGQVSYGHDHGKQIIELFICKRGSCTWKNVGASKGSYPVSFTIQGYITQKELG